MELFHRNIFKKRGQAEILQFLEFLAYNSLYAIVDNFDCFPCISLHQYEIILTLMELLLTR
jgi:hypothetical protein